MAEVAEIVINTDKVKEQTKYFKKDHKKFDRYMQTAFSQK